MREHIWEASATNTKVNNRYQRFFDLLNLTKVFHKSITLNYIKSSGVADRVRRARQCEWGLTRIGADL